MATESEMGRRSSLITTALLFYSLLLGGALLWGALSGRPWLGADPGQLSLVSLGGGVAAGLFLALFVAWFSRFCWAHFQWAEQLFQWFAELLGSLSWGDVTFLALASGVAEEAFFRGAMQPALGLHLTSILFGLVHFPAQWRLLSWTIFALAIGYAFGVIVMVSGNIYGAVVGHFLINLLNLHALSRAARKV